MTFKVQWATLSPTKAVVRTEAFADIEQAKEAAQLFMLSIPGTVEAKVLDADGNQLDIWVRDNSPVE